MSRSQEKREKRDKKRMERGLQPRTTVAQRRHRIVPDYPKPTATERMAENDSVFSKHGLILPPHAGIRLVRMKK